MRTAGLVALGFLEVLVSLGLFGQISLEVMSAIYAAMFYLLFFKGENWGTPVLIGITLGNELLGTSRFGEATLLAFITLLLFYIFSERLRFTSLFVRYIVALLLLETSYTLLLYSLHHFLERLIPVLILYLVSCFISFLASNRNSTSAYELI